MFCKMCGSKVDGNSNFCSNCGAKLGASRPQNSIKETLSQTIGGKLIGNFNEADLFAANQFLKSHNFGKVFWNFNMAPGQVRGITFTCEILENPVPYVFQMEMISPTGARTFGALFSLLNAWNADAALNDWIKLNPNKRVKSSRVITHKGVPTQLYILFTVLK
ncbi:zinc ribbon domain-containing protein [Clostridium sp. YIM B02551]|uniref:zinc ribbon domain-containing protein n=1 Tax=Clostridium sp. YIM B02551 TaxID=2910679 RepID=UPI001EEB482C|nr:zinc ribbon domain-containing protein [Clostridium sp. YIM B02551]